jgi:hypothetical protein
MEVAGSAGRAARESGRQAQRSETTVSPRDFERSAPAWLEHIVRLRDAGRHTEADAELKRFRERYPQVAVPRVALPPADAAGTR